MEITLVNVNHSEIDKVLALLRSAALTLQSKGVDQWRFWLSPPDDKVQWVLNGILDNEFFFIQQETTVVGIVRLSLTDEIYWGNQITPAFYIHSLVIEEHYSGNKLGEKVLNQVMFQAAKNSIPLLRLDCISSNQKLCNYYENQGFVKVGEKQMPHSMNNLYEKQL